MELVHGVDLVGNVLHLMRGLMARNDLVMLSDDVFAIGLLLNETTHQDLFTAIVDHYELWLSLLHGNIHIYVLVVLATRNQTQNFRVTIFDVELIPALGRWTFVFLVVFLLVSFVRNCSNVAASIDFVASHGIVVDLGLENVFLGFGCFGFVEMLTMDLVLAMMIVLILIVFDEHLGHDFLSIEVVVLVVDQIGG